MKFINRMNKTRVFYSQNIYRIIYYLKKYNLNTPKRNTDPLVIFIVDPKKKHPGLMDLLKVIISIFYIAKINGFNFKIHFHSPFELNKFLNFNQVDWTCKDEDILYSLKKSRILNYYGNNHLYQLNKKIVQYHVYNYEGKNLLQQLEIEHWEKIWVDCFNELFKPSNLLEQNLSLQGYQRGKYIAVHFRFVNSIEHLENGYNKTLEGEELKIFINDCINQLYSIQMKNENIPLLVFSDTNRFLKIAKEKGFNSLEGEVKHISYTNDYDKIMKTFIDLFMMSRASKIYRMQNKHLYPSVFSYYASIIGQNEFIQLNF